MLQYAAELEDRQERGLEAAFVGAFRIPRRSLPAVTLPVDRCHIDPQMARRMRDDRIGAGVAPSVPFEAPTEILAK
jgi:hypothetical protein